jgi:FlaA1/EpsC-like NDP-sugar epimerase
VTPPDLTRFFMTIQEAVSLIVQAGAIGGRGEIFVLDMGEPIRILDLARNMIRLSGQEPDRDIAIEFVGARAGEKLHEQLWGEGEQVGDTPHPKIKRARRPPVDAGWLEGELADLDHLVEEGDTLGLVGRLSRTVGAPHRLVDQVGEADLARRQS